MEMLKKERWGDTETREKERISLSFTCGPQKPWFKGPIPLLPSPHRSHHPHLNLPAHRGLFCEFICVDFLALAQQGKLFFILLFFLFFRTSWTRSCLACSEWTRKPWEGESKRSQSFPSHAHEHPHTSLVYTTCIYRTWERISSLWETLDTQSQQTKGTTASSETRICNHGFTIPSHPTRCLSPLRPTSLDPTDSLQSAFGASGIQLAFGASIRYSNLTLTVTVTAPPSAWEDRIKRTGFPPLSPFALLELLLLLF